MSLSNTVLSLNVITESVDTVARTTIPVPVDITVSQMLIAANPSRKGLTLWNQSASDVLIDFGVPPTANSYAFKLNPGGYWELPYLYTGSIHGLWNGGGGIGLFVRELT